jgi:hypothetical protein
MLAYNPGNFLWQLTLSDAVRDCSLLSVQLKPVKTGSQLVRHAHRLVFHLTEVTRPRRRCSQDGLLQGRVLEPQL